MNFFKRSILFPLISLIMVFLFFDSCQKSAKPDNRILQLNVGAGSDLISLTFDLTKVEKSIEKEALLLNGGITDFTLPFNKLNSTLKRENISGAEIINQIEIIPHPESIQTTIIFRLTTKGTGGGLGHIGGSLVIIFSLNKKILKDSNKGILKTPVKGKLLFTDQVLKVVPEYVQGDMSKVGVKSKMYEGFLPGINHGTFFYGYVMFDPTNPKSKEDAYFEFSSSESEKIWSLEELERKEQTVKE